MPNYGNRSPPPPATSRRHRHNPDIGIIVERDPRVTGEPQVVVLAVDQTPGQGVVFAHQLAAPGTGGLHTEQRRAAVTVDRRGDRGGVEALEGGSVGVGAGRECAFDQRVELAQRVASLGDPAPLALVGEVGDGAQLTQDVGLIPMSG